MLRLRRCVLACVFSGPLTVLTAPQGRKELTGSCKTTRIHTGSAGAVLHSQVVWGGRLHNFFAQEACCTAPVPSILVHGAPLRRLGPPGLLGHDDLVHAQHRAHSLRRQLERPPLCQVQVVDAVLGQIPVTRNLTISYGGMMAGVEPCILKPEACQLNCMLSAAC